MTKITQLTIDDIRFETSKGKHGSDAMNPDPDYSAAYLRLHTDGPLTGHGLTFTLGRGTDLCALAVEAYRDRIEGCSLAEIINNPNDFYCELTGDSQLRWLGPEKGVMHMAAAAIINAVWDLMAKQAGKPLWQLLCEMSPQQLVNCVDFRYLTDAITPAEAIDLLSRLLPTRQNRIDELREQGYPAYTTSVGWLGYEDEQLIELCRQAKRDGWSAVKMKVGADLDDDRRRLGIVRREMGADVHMMMDANQVWDVSQAIEWVQALAEFNPVWIEEPTNPDDILGHAAIAKAIAPIGVATGEMAQNRITFKQLMQAHAIQFCQVDSCRMGGVNEAIAVLLMAAKFNIPVCPHGGGVGLCEHIQHLSIFDYVCVSGSLERRWTEYVNHLHEHFKDPCIIRNGHYVVPTMPGYSIEMKQASIEAHRFTD